MSLIDIYQSKNCHQETGGEILNPLLLAADLWGHEANKLVFHTYTVISCSFVRKVWVRFRQI